MTKALVVDDERKMRRILQMVLERMSIDSVVAETGAEALERFDREQVDLVLTDLKMPGMTGIELLSELRVRDPDLPVIVLTAFGTVQTAVEAMKAGACDYVLKPFDLDAIEITIRKALDLSRYRTENRYLREREDRIPAFENLVGASPAMQQVYELVRRLGPTRSTVLVTGETGTGKELVARAIHALSPRRERLFVPLNCAAIPGELLESELFGHTRGAFTGAHADRAGKFEVAHGGTLFLDEIGDMPIALQAKLLRVLQEGVIERVGSNKPIALDVRMISSTHRDLPARIREGTFREDLYYRLNVFNVALPPLRDRREDIGHLATFLLTRFARELGREMPTLTAEALAALERYEWPGNVRELQNVMERAAVLATGREIDPAVFRQLGPAGTGPAPEPSPESFALEAAVEQFERKHILRALAAAGDNKSQAARLLGVSERTLWYKLKRYGL
ncbi:MAG TPA: sigma-54 dependent transcriptional regulator [Candidatus Eisenbacteria bacterium]|nr:sigma-54 dependent transcriptional regulator [Candidatus Eisenbacteria bacterium]